MKIKPQHIQKIARRNGCSYRRAAKIAGAHGGKRSGETRRRREAEQGQGDLL